MSIFEKQYSDADDCSQEASSRCDNNGLVSVSSPFDVAETARHIGIALKEHGLRLVTSVDHAKAAVAVGLHMRPTILLLAGNALSGTPLMQQHPTLAIDLPHKFLVYQDDQEQTWITFNDPGHVLARHQLNDKKELANKLKQVLTRIAMDAVSH